MSAVVAMLAEVLACCDLVTVDVLLLRDQGNGYLVDKDGRAVVIDARDVVDVEFNSELDISLTVPRSVAVANGLI